MKWFNKQNYFTKYLLCIALLFICLLLIRTIVMNNNTLAYTNEDIYIKNNILIDNDNYLVNVYYPKFKDSEINRIVTNLIYPYIKSFEKNSKDIEMKTKLEINYSLFFINKHVNIFFEINNSIDAKDINKSILIDLNKRKLSNISEIYNEDLLNEKLQTLKDKYPSYVSNVILNQNKTDFNYLITEEGFTIYFTNLKYDKNISYIPNLKVTLNENVIEENYNIDTSKKMIALTFDDGPSEYTMEILKCLKLNNSKGTFFELGIHMNKFKEVTKRLYDSGMEVGNHTYSHKYLTKLKLSRALNEINSTSILYNQITGDNMHLMRVPYGSINSTIRQNAPFPIIAWNIDTKDWLYRDAEVSAPIVLDYVKDGDIILMHDIYNSSVELAKIIVPELKARGYELVTVSELAKYKNYNLEPGVVVREIK